MSYFLLKKELAVSTNLILPGADESSDLVLDLYTFLLSEFKDRISSYLDKDLPR